MFNKPRTKTVSAIALTLSLIGSTAFADTLKLVSSWASNQATTRVNVETFVAKVNEYTGGDTTISVVGPDAISPLELIEPLQTGSIDMIFTHPAYHAGTTKIGIAADGIAVDPKTWRETGIFDAFDKYYQSIGLKVVGITPLGQRGFRFVTN